MHHKLGDTIAIQYSGGALVNRFDTYRRRVHWQTDAQNKAEAGKVREDKRAWVVTRRKDRTELMTCFTLWFFFDLFSSFSFCFL